MNIEDDSLELMSDIQNGDVRSPNNNPELDLGGDLPVDTVKAQ